MPKIMHMRHVMRRSCTCKRGGDVPVCGAVSATESHRSPSLLALLAPGRPEFRRWREQPALPCPQASRIETDVLSFLYRKEFQNRRFSLKCCKNVAMLQKIVLDQWSNCKTSCLTSEFDHWSNHWPPQCIIYPRPLLLSGVRCALSARPPEHYLNCW